MAAVHFTTIQHMGALHSLYLESHISAVFVPNDNVYGMFISVDKVFVH